MAPVILAKAHWSYYHSEKDIRHFKKAEVWNELKTLQTELIRRFPHSLKRHNWFAKSACLAGDFETARREFEEIGDNWLKNVWSTKKDFEYYKTLAFNEP